MSISTASFSTLEHPPARIFIVHHLPNFPQHCCNFERQPASIMSISRTSFSTLEHPPARIFNVHHLPNFLKHCCDLERQPASIVSRTSLSTSTIWGTFKESWLWLRSCQGQSLGSTNAPVQNNRLKAKKGSCAHCHDRVPMLLRSPHCICHVGSRTRACTAHFSKLLWRLEPSQAKRELSFKQVPWISFCLHAESLQQVVSENNLPIAVELKNDVSAVCARRDRPGFEDARTLDII